MKCIIHIIINGIEVGGGTMGFVPRKGEEIEINGHVLVIENVRYIITNGVDWNEVSLYVTPA